MGLLSVLFDIEPRQKDVHFYANRLSEQMLQIAKVGRSIESYIPRAYQECVNRDFIESALTAFKSVGGQSGDAALEIYRDIEKDIETMQEFIHNWKNSTDIDKKVLSLAESLYFQLEKLKTFIEDTPPDMMKDCKEVVINKRKRR